MPNYLSEKEWRTELKQLKIDKDGGLADALRDWEKTRGKDPEDESAALETVLAKNAAAQKLLKDQKGLVKFASSMAAAIKEEQKRLEKALAAAAEGDEASAPDKALFTGLKRAKSARMFFAAVVKGATDGHLIVGKMKVKPAEIADAKKVLGGGKVFRGICLVEDGTHVFELRKEPPPTLAKLLKLCAKNQAALRIRAICRVAQFAEDLGDEPDDDLDSTPAAPPVPPPASAAPQTPAPTASTPPPAPPTSKPVDSAPATPPPADLDKLRAAWDVIRNRAAADVQKLQKAILLEFQEHDQFGEVQQKVRELGAVLTSLNADLATALQTAHAAKSDDERKSHRAAARDVVRRIQQFVTTDEWMSKIDTNPFIPLKVQKPLADALAILDRNLA